jgi:CheY-like chemotaxis protein
MTDTDPIEIVLIEDNPHDVELALHALRKHHLANHIKVLRDGAEALEYLCADDSPVCGGRAPKVILLDLKLPKVDGIEVLRQLKSDPRTQRIPVVALTTSREDRDLDATYRLGVNSYIVKPVEFDNFIAAMGTLGIYWIAINQPPRAWDGKPL